MRTVLEGDRKLGSSGANAGTLRIAVVNWSNRLAGGAESSLLEVVHQLHGAGYTVGVWTELEEPRDREPMPLPAGTTSWSAAELGFERALAELRAWAPDLVLVNLTTSAETEASVLDIAPAVLIAHGYHGTCISGLKAHQQPDVTPCGKAFGWQCLVHFYPRRCGGLNPLTMVSDFRRNLTRRDLFARYRAIVTYSAHMRDELVRHVTRPERVHVIPMGIPLPTAVVPERAHPGAEWRLLFTGRMDRMKGGAVLLQALPDVAAGLDRPVHLTLVGDGPERASWERLSGEIVARCAGRVAVSFAGWKRARELEEIRGSADLLVVPSLWPEPFGMVGPEAGLLGVPAVAFDVGGIREWLHEGVNGHLAPAGPATAANLAAAILRSLATPGHYAALRQGAVEVARRFNSASHFGALARVFDRALMFTP